MEDSKGEMEVAGQHEGDFAPPAGLCQESSGECTTVASWTVEWNGGDWETVIRFSPPLHIVLEPAPKAG